MPYVNVKYKIGQVVSIGPTIGKITAIFVRGKSRAYEFSYVDINGDPKSVTTEECELEVVEVNGGIGFKGKNDAST